MLMQKEGRLDDCRPFVPMVQRQKTNVLFLFNFSQLTEPTTSRIQNPSELLNPVQLGGRGRCRAAGERTFAMWTASAASFSLRHCLHPQHVSLVFLEERLSRRMTTDQETAGETLFCFRQRGSAAVNDFVTMRGNPPRRLVREQQWCKQAQVKLSWCKLS